jgi:hypothetical protein
VILDYPLLITGGGWGAALYIMRRIASKIETRLDQVEDHETRLQVIERVCAIRHDDEHSRPKRPGYSFSP